MAMPRTGAGSSRSLEARVLASFRQRESLSRNRVVVVCSARSTGKKAEGTTSRFHPGELEGEQCHSHGETSLIGVYSKLRGVGAATNNEEEQRELVEQSRGLVMDICNDHTFAAESFVQDPTLRESLIDKIKSECHELIEYVVAAKRFHLEINARSKDRVISFGEKLSCLFMTTLLQDTGVDAEYVDLCDALHCDSPGGLLDAGFYKATAAAFASKIAACEHRVPVVTGFFGNVPGSLIDGDIGRGYTDLCAALCAVGLGAEELQVWKEVDGIFTADPSKVPTARLLTTITPSEAAELTFYGSEVIHHLTMDQVIRAQPPIPIRIKNVKNPRGNGTIVLPDPGMSAGRQLHRTRPSQTHLDRLTGKPKRPTAVTIKDHITVINVHSNKRSISHGFFARVFSILDRHSISVDLISTSEVHVSLAIHAGSAEVDAFNKARDELAECGDVSVLSEMAILSLVGADMKNMIGVAGMMFSTLGEHNVNIEMISQGGTLTTSPRSLRSLAVSASDLSNRTTAKLSRPGKANNASTTHATGLKLPDMYKSKGGAAHRGSSILSALKATEMLDARSNLPAEILVAILDYLPIADQMRFARASRRMQEMVYDDTRWVSRLRSMECWNEREARQRFEDFVRRRREAAERAKSASLQANGAAPKPTTTTLFDASIEEQKQQKATSEVQDGFETMTIGAPARDPQQDPAAYLDVFKKVKSIRGGARQEYGKIYGALAPFYFDVVKARSHADPIIFQAFRDPETQARMLSNLLRFSKSDWSEGCGPRSDKLKSMISIFEGAVLREFEQGYEFWDVDGRMKRYAHVLHSLNGARTGIDLFVQKHPIFDDRQLTLNPMDCLNQGTVDGISLEPSRLFFEMLLAKVNDQSDVIERIFPEPVEVFWALLDRVREDIIMEYTTPLFDEAHERSIASYLKAVSGIFEQTYLFFQSVKPPSGFEGDLDEKAKEFTLRVFEPHFDLYTQEELDFFTKQADTEVANWDRKLSEQDSSLESFYMSNINRSADKKDFLSSFKKVIMMPVTVLPSFPMGSPFGTSKPAATGAPASTTGLTPQPSRPTTPGLSTLDGKHSPLPEKAPTDELEAKAALMTSKLEGIKSLFSIEVALKLVHAAKASLGRMSPFIRLGGQTGEEAKEQCANIFVVLLRILGQKHVKTGFDMAVAHLSHYNPREVSDHNQSGVAPLVTFIELVNVGDLISQMIDVFYEQQLSTPKIADKNDFLDPAGLAKKKFEQMLDESVAAGLNKGIDVLMDEVEYLHGTTQSPTDYNPPPAGTAPDKRASVLGGPAAAEMDIGPTETAKRIVDLVSSHTRMLVGTTDKSMLDVFNGEVGLRLFTAICKHLKRQRVSTDGAIKLIADMNLYSDYVRTLRNNDLLPYFRALRELSQIYLIDPAHAKEMATVIADGDRFAGVFRAEEVYEYAQRRADWYQVKTRVERAMYGLECVVMLQHRTRLHPLTKVELAGDLGAPVGPLVLGLAGAALEVGNHLLLAAALAGEVLLAAVLEHLAGGDALLGVEGEGADEQVDAVGADGAEAHLEPVLAADGVLAGDGVLGELGDARPVVVGGGADGLADHLDLVQLVVAGHVGGAEDELGEDGADGPDVDGAAVVLGAEEQLRGSVPAGDDVGRHVLVGVGEAAGQTEIGELDLAVRGDEQVVGLDIAVQDETLVAEPDGAGEHAHPGLDVGGAVADVVGVADEHLEVAEGQVLEHEVEVLVLGGEDAEQGDDVGVAQLLEVLELAHGVGRHALGVLLLNLDLLDGDERRRLGAQVAEEDDGVGTLTELLACTRRPPKGVS
ncbi:Aspartate kinase FUB3 [Paramyrothecium foliicola]|nr:Aspartate kinase FUB3 [Paramyrothecium foliicola]